jgi:hypothetical protein
VQEFDGKFQPHSVLSTHLEAVRSSDGFFLSGQAIGDDVPQSALGIAGMVHLQFASNPATSLFGPAQAIISYAEGATGSIICKRGAAACGGR